MEAMISHKTLSSSFETLTLHFDCRDKGVSQKSPYEKNFDPSYNLVGARYYDADIGLWTSVDAARQHWSGYTYGSNNPVNRVDQDGNWDNVVMPKNTRNDKGEIVPDQNTLAWKSISKYYGNNEGVFDIALHGTPQGLQLPIETKIGTRTYLSWQIVGDPKQMTEILMKNGWDGKQELILHGCNTANSAKALAEFNKVKVTGTNGFLQPKGGDLTVKTVSGDWSTQIHD